MHLTPQQLNELYPYLFGFWAAIGLVALAFFTFNKNASLKRRVLIVGSIATNVLMLVFFWATGAPPLFLVFAAAVVGYGLWQSIHLTRFCDACAALNAPQGHRQARTECRKCGAALAKP
ncbi:hypothetical protein QE400_001834 [Xanthomonas sacchari]|uniref:hypothetical protein n=1 Tax=Xanthomonas sacchari TaxID=56458 RepID=UPI00278786A0|nr:hypothetical protein [Xanthomonas sacchari]MDQ1092421.1 hypothetical protein [Xanthomonas sacchari]